MTNQWTREAVNNAFFNLYQIAAEEAGLILVVKGDKNEKNSDNGSHVLADRSERAS